MCRRHRRHELGLVDPPVLLLLLAWGAAWGLAGTLLGWSVWLILSCALGSGYLGVLGLVWGDGILTRLRAPRKGGGRP